MGRVVAIRRRKGQLLAMISGWGRWLFSALKRMTTWLCVTIQKSDSSLGGGDTVLACQNCITPTQRNTGEKPHDLVQGVMNYAADGLVFWMPQLGKKRELVGSVNAKWASISVPKTLVPCGGCAH
jgi:hypothetical protein